MSVSGFLRSTHQFFLGLRHGSKKVFNDGSMLRYLHREGLEYVHPDERRMGIEKYWLMNEPDIDYQIYLNPWLPPHESEFITEDVAQEIARKVEAYWDERGCVCRVEIQEVMDRQSATKPAFS